MPPQYIIIDPRPMNLAQFSNLPYAIQFAAVRSHGRLLIQRRANQTVVVNLYVMPAGFFVEITFDTVACGVASLWAVPATDRLEDYADTVLLPAWVNSDNVPR